MHRIYSELDHTSFTRYKRYLEMTGQKMKDHIMVRVINDIRSWEEDNQELVKYWDKLNEIKETVKVK